MENAIRVEPIELAWEDDQTHALAFYPPKSRPAAKSVAVFAHGYTSHKATLLNWAARLCEEGIPALIFDLPGHFLGNFSRVSSFEAFRDEAPSLFQQAHVQLLKRVQNQHPDYQAEHCVLGGHSLGALLALKALGLDHFQKISTQAVCVGLGLPPRGKVHLFDTPFYKSTLAIRAQLVDPNLAPEKIFPWIKQEKEQMQITGQKIYFLTGKDDLVVGEDGTERLVDHLKEQGNQVELEKPTKLPHHQPELAAAHIKKYLKNQGLFV